MGSVRLSVRVSEDDRKWLEEEVKRIGEKKTDVSEQVRICIAHRRIALMPKWKQDELRQKLFGGSSVVGNG